MHGNKTSAAFLSSLLFVAGLASLVGLPPAAAQTTIVPITTADWCDLDHNGHLDAVAITMGAGAPPLTDIYPSDFNIQGTRKGTGFSPGNLCTGGAGDFTILFPESDAMDAGVANSGGTFNPPTLGFIPHSPSYNFGAPAARNDRAAPVLKAA
jgi:hypothetical protein